MQFTAGFKRGDFQFGWHKGKLYRLPKRVKNRNYSLKEITQVVIYKNKNGEEVKGYRCALDKLTVEQAKAASTKVDWSIKSITSKDFPK